MKTVKVSARQLSKLVREAFGDKLSNVNMQAQGDKARNVNRYPGTSLEMLANELEALWNRQMGRQAYVEALEAVPGGVMLVPEHMPAEERIERWFNATFDPYNVSATWDVVNTEHGPAIMINVTHADVKKMHRLGFSS